MSEQLSAPEARVRAQSDYDVHKQLSHELSDAQVDSAESTAELGRIATVAHDRIQEQGITPNLRTEPKMADTLTRRNADRTLSEGNIDNYVLGRQLEATDNLAANDRQRVKTAKAIVEAEAAMQAQGVNENLGAYQQAAAADATAAGKKPNL